MITFARSSRAGLLAWALTSASCAAPPAASPLSSPSAPPATLATVPTPGPLIVVDATDVLLDGERVGDAAALEREGRLRRVDALLLHLQKLVRENQGSHPLKLWLDLRNAGSLSAIDVMMTATSAIGAGANPLVDLRTSNGWFEGRWDGLGHFAEAHRRLRVAYAGEPLAVAFESDESCDAVPEAKTVPVAAFGDYLDRVAPERRPIDAIHLSLGADVPFARALEVLEVARRHAGSDLAFAVSARARDAKPPERRCGHPLLNGGRLPQETIQAIVRSHFDTMRRCYEDGLRRDPKLVGKVSVRFVIERDGHVSDAHAVPESSSMPDQIVSECVAAAYGALVFPPPDGGIVTVVYPVIFSPE